MTQASDPFFRTFHALRIKGFATTPMICDIAAMPVSVVEQHLADLQSREWVQYREARQLWQLTAIGRDEHRMALAEDVGHTHIADRLRPPYMSFLELNDRFKALCGEWQLRDGVPNDHADSAYDRSVIDRLVALNELAVPVVDQMGAVLERLSPYGRRLVASCQRVTSGETNMFTGVMCGSYHDVWMELHEDLILTQGIDRTAEGSF